MDVSQRQARESSCDARTVVAVGCQGWEVGKVVDQECPLGGGDFGCHRKFDAQSIGLWWKSHVHATGVDLRQK